MPSDHPESRHPTPQQMYLRLEEALELLAASGPDQEAWARSLQVRVPPDEMRLLYLDVIPGLLYLFREGRLIDDEDESALLRLEAFLIRSKDDSTPYAKWSVVSESPEWTQIRELAAATLLSLNRPPDKKALPPVSV